MTFLQMCRFQISDSDKIDYDVVIYIYSNNDEKKIVFNLACAVYV